MGYLKTDKDTKKLGKFIALGDKSDTIDTNLTTPRAVKYEELSNYIMFSLMLIRMMAMEKFRQIKRP